MKTQQSWLICRVATLPPIVILDCQAEARDQSKVEVTTNDQKRQGE